MSRTVRDWSRVEARGRIAAFALLFAGLALTLAISFVVTPEDIEQGRVVLSPPCTFKRLTGYDCMSCGLTRAFAALSHGRLDAALGYHRASPVVYLLFWLGALASLGALARAVRGLRLKPDAATPRPDPKLKFPPSSRHGHP